MTTTPGVGHGGSHPCKGSFYQERRLNFEKIGIGGKLLILRHPECSCNTGCRRVALYHPRPQLIELTDDWIVKAIARVRFGDGCGGPEVEVDWKHGVILDLMGCYDEVAIEIIEVTGSSPPDEDNPYVVGVLSACCGAGAARGCATRTTALFSVPDDEGAVVPIPPFAYAVAFAPRDAFGSTAMRDQFFSATTGLIQAGSGAAAPITTTSGDNLPDPWMLIGGAESIIVLNDNATTLEFEVVFLIGV